VDARTKLNHLPDGRIDGSYWEAQYHGGLSVDDIEEVIFPINSSAGLGSTEAEIRRRFRKGIDILEKKRIPYRFLDRSQAKYLR
jgi:hypothetical protein